jgi:hypothetical protein
MSEHKVYFLRRADGLIKIGTTFRFAQRLETLIKSHGPLEVIRVINGDRQRERSIHRLFHVHHEYGEWFRPSAELLAAIPKLEDGFLVSVTKDDAKAEWIAAEQEFMAEVVAKAKQLVKLRIMRQRLTQEQAITAINDDYGFPGWFFTHLVKGKASTVSAYGLSVLQRALRAEMQASIQELEAEIAAERAALNQGRQVR